MKPLNEMTDEEVEAWNSEPNADPILTCDICNRREWSGDLTDDWNGETGNHASCEAKGSTSAGDLDNEMTRDFLLNHAASQGDDEEFTRLSGIEDATMDNYEQATVSVIEMTAEDYERAANSLTKLFATLASAVGNGLDWTAETREAVTLTCMSAFELGCHMSHHNPDIAKTWAMLLGGAEGAPRWLTTHALSHDVTNMMTGKVVAKGVSQLQGERLVNSLNAADEEQQKGKAN